MTATSPDIVGSTMRTLPKGVGESVVYFIAGPGGIKIGATTNLHSRFTSLNIGSGAAPLTIIGSVPGGYDLERHLHRMLWAYRIRGEWFQDCKEVRDAIARAGELAVPSETKLQNEYVAWASKSLPAIAHPRPEHEQMKDTIARVARLLGFKYSRVFELWYGRARTLAIHERDAINAALEATYG